MKVDSLKKLYHDQLRDLYDAENRLVKALPKMAKAASNAELKQGFEEHLEQTKVHVERLEQIFEACGEKPDRQDLQGHAGADRRGRGDHEGRRRRPRSWTPRLIAAAQHVEHYEMAGYGSVMAYAKILKEKDALKLLKQTLNEEKQTDEKLTDLAESVVNLEAV